MRPPPIGPAETFASVDVTVWDVHLQDDGLATARIEIDGERSFCTLVQRDGCRLVDGYDAAVDVGAPPG